MAGEVKLTETQNEILKAASIDKAVIWPRGDCRALRQYAKGSKDGRVHFMAPVGPAFSLFLAGLLTSEGVITSAGRRALEDRT